MKKRINLRTCCLCKKKLLKSEFLRFYKSDSLLYIDLNHLNLYRGYYLCNNKEHFDKLVNNKIRLLANTKLDISILNYIKECYDKKE